MSSRGSGVTLVPSTQAIVWSSDSTLSEIFILHPKSWFMSSCAVHCLLYVIILSVFDPFSEHIFS